ncbi:lipoprotein 17-related variable surface protein [Metamycoplasma arthritidis]|nr:lipoprotein 17-related variable surface protein [Metamycoplasma arthritidis]
MVILESHLPSGIKLIEKSTHDMKDKKGTLTIKCKFSYNGVETGDMFYTIKGFKKQ